MRSKTSRMRCSGVVNCRYSARMLLMSPERFVPFWYAKRSISAMISSLSASE